MDKELTNENLEKVTGGVRYHVTLWRCPNCGATRERSERIGDYSDFAYFRCRSCGTLMTEMADSWTEER